MLGCLSSKGSSGHCQPDHCGESSRTKMPMWRLTYSDLSTHGHFKSCIDPADASRISRASCEINV